MAVDKGAIMDGHVLVLPIEHYPSQLSLSASAFSEMERYLSALRSCFAAQVHIASGLAVRASCSRKVPLIQ